jgi:histidine ammonia-lyase
MPSNHRYHSRLLKKWGGLGMKQKITIDGNSVNLDQVVATAKGAIFELAASARQRMDESRQYIENKMKSGDAIYGVNTGFGALSAVRVSDNDLDQLQLNIIRSHSAGIGEPLNYEQTRVVLLLRANTLARGHSGVRSAVVDKILEFLNADVLPVVPSQGTLGASGDLVPLSHVALSLIGEGKVWDLQNHKPVATAQVLKEKNILPLVPHAKEGLALINGCQVMTAIGLLTIGRIMDLNLLFDLSGCMSLEALRGGRGPFDALVSATRPHRGEIQTARNLLDILGEDSEIGNSHFDCDRVQDAYSLRCMPAVHGAVKDATKNALETLLVEANSSTDNPLVFDRENKILSCGNFHGEPVAFQMDFLGIAMSALASISQCRISRMITPLFSRLPAFLTPNPGLNSGMMMVETAAASLVSENKVLAHPASVDSIPVSVDKEDHVSMGTIAARKLKSITDNAENVLAMEMLTNMQALHLLRPLKAAGTVEATFQHLHKRITLAKTDRVFSEDLDFLRDEIRSGELVRILNAHAPKVKCW